MERADAVSVPPPRGLGQVIATGVGRILVSIFVPIVAFIVLYAGFVFLKDSGAPRIVIVVVAIVWGIGGVAMLYVVANWLTEQLPLAGSDGSCRSCSSGLPWRSSRSTCWSRRSSPPGKACSTRRAAQFVGLDNYVYAFTNPEMITAIRNNVLWLVFGTLFSTGLGLVMAVLVERSRLDRLAKTLIFLPMAISFVGASVIWRFVYSYQPEGETADRAAQRDPRRVRYRARLLADGEPLNTILLIVILIWGQVGFAMVIISAPP